jgi:hypothetical protein
MEWLLFCLGVGFCSHFDYGVREAGEALATAFPSPWVEGALRATQDAEAAVRLRRARVAAVTRELDRMAGGRCHYPRAADLEAEGWVFWQGGPLTSDPAWDFPDTPAEFWFDCEEGGTRHRTRAGLLAYTLRTGDWSPAEKILLKK